MTSILKAENIQDADGNNIINESGNTITIGASGDTTNIIGTLQNDGAAVGGVNTPAFSAERSSAQSISDATRTTILFNNEFLDSSSAYDTSTGKFTPQTAGKYFVIANIILQSGSNSNFSFGFVELYKNSSVITESVFDDRGDENSRCYTAAPSAVVDMNGSSDFILIQAYLNANSGTPEVSDMSTFTAFKIIE